MKLLLAIVLSLALFAGNPTNSFAKKDVVTWNLQAAYPMGTKVTMHAVEWAEAIEKLTDGRLKIKIHPPGALSGVTDIITYLQRGVFQAAMTAGPFYTGVIPEGNLELGLPLSWQSYDEIWDAMENRGLGEVIREAYAEKNVEWFYAGADPYYHFATTFPVEKLEDLKGKRIRAIGMYAEYVRSLGASAVTIPGGELYMALKLGTIDGAIYGAVGLQDVKLHEVVDYYVFPSAVNINVCLLINKDALADLPDDIESIVRGTQYILHDSAMRYCRATKEAMNKSVEEGSIEIERLPEEELRKMRHRVAPLWEKQAEISPRMKKGVEIVREQMRDYGRPIE